MAFTKIDADAVNADEPIDAFVLQGVDANLDAARDNRVRRCAFGWPSDNLPVVASHKTVAYAIARWPVIPGVTQVSIDIRHTIANAAVNMGLAKIQRDGRLDLADADLTPVATGANTTTTLNCDVTAFQGDTVDLFLLVKSDMATSPAPEQETINGATDGNIITNWTRITIPAGHSITLFGNTGDRWAISFTDASSGSTLVEGDEFPDTRTIIRMSTPSGPTDLDVWPWMPADERTGLWSGGNYNVTIDTLGMSTIQGISVYDSTVTAFPDRQGRQLPGVPPVSAAIGDLYRRGRGLHAHHTRVYRCGASYDLARLDSAGDVLSLWDEYVEYQTLTWDVLGSCWLGSYPRNNVEGGASRYRTSAVVTGWLYGVVGTADLLVASASLRASIYSFSGTTWSGSVKNGVTRNVNVEMLRPYHLESAPLFCHGLVDAPLFHYLRGAVGAEDLGTTGAGMTPFAIRVEDDQTTATDRMLRLEIKGTTPNPPDIFGFTWAARIHCLGLTVYELPGVYGA